jgi:hypothetical protein
VEGLSDEEIGKISMYLNMDMIGSPNFVRFVLDGDGSASTFEPLPQAGSPMAHIEATYMQYFDEVGLPVEEEPFSNSYQYTGKRSIVKINQPPPIVLAGLSYICSIHVIPSHSFR